MPVHVNGFQKKKKKPVGGDVEIECDTFHRKLVPDVPLVKLPLGLDQTRLVRCERGRVAGLPDKERD